MTTENLNAFKSAAELAAGGEENPGDAQAALELANAEAAGQAAAEAGDDTAGDDAAAGADTDAGGDDDDTDEPKEHLTPRQKKMQEIAAKQNGVRDEDNAEFIAAHKTPAADAAAVDEQGHTDEQVQKAVDAQPEYRIQKNDAGVDCAVLKINGAEVLKPLRDVFAQAQKDAAADQKLEKASTTMQTLQRWNQDLTTREQQVEARLKEIQTLAKPQNSETSPSDKDVGKADDVYRAFVEALYDEDTDGATKHLQSLLTGRGDPTQAMSKQEIQETVSTLITEQQQIGNLKAERERAQASLQEEAVQEWQTAKQTFVGEFPEIKQGTPAWKMASNLCAQIQQEPEYKGASYLKIMREAGKRVREVATDLTPQLKDRTAQKLNSQRHVASRSSTPQVRGRVTEPEKPRSQHDLIKDMRRTRRPNQAY